MTTAYSNQQLYHMAGENYRTLKSFCELLETEGYWEQAECVLHMKSEEMLELYVQSLLVCFAVYCKHMSKAERDFIAALSERNELAFTTETKDTKVHEAAERFQKNPPILFQLLSLRDVEHGFKKYRSGGESTDNKRKLWKSNLFFFTECPSGIGTVGEMWLF